MKQRYHASMKLNLKKFNQILWSNFRGMVQDMLDPEFYLGKYFTKNTNTGEKTTRIGCFTDTGCKQSPLEIIDFDAEENVTLERQTYYCVPVPGENQWIKDSYKQAFNNDPVIMQEERNNAQKRRLDEDEIVVNEEKMETEISSKTSNSLEKKLRENNTESAEGSQQKGAEAKPKSKIDYARNFPLSEEKGNAAFVKMYSKTTSLKLNDVAEFICILSVDPHFAQSSMQEEMETNEVTWHEFNMEEDRAHCPPPSLVPRLHCLYYNKLEELNPNVRNNHTDYECASKELTSIRADLIQTLKGLLGGDGIAAEYLLLHLISSVYGRVGAMCVGKFALNLFKLPKTSR
ncbi:mini-chromosome maintenance complex-binding protein-like [Clytia hemisphaerica]